MIDYCFHRAIRKNDFEEWIFYRHNIKSEERFVVFFEPNFIEAYLITGDKNIEENEDYISIIHGVYHHHYDLYDEKFNIVYVDLINEKGNPLDSLEVSSLLSDISEDIIKKRGKQV